MNDVIIATTPADAAAIETVRTHHAELAGGLAARVSALQRAARSGDNASPARTELVDWARAELLPHAAAEEAALYPAGRALAPAQMLVDAMLAEHRVLVDLVGQLSSGDAVQAVGAATALQVLFETHMQKENEQLLPALAEASGVSLGGLLAQMHAALHEQQVIHGTADHTASAHPAGHSCSCGEQDPEGAPELDTRVIPHAIRHATIFGALDAVRPGAAIVIAASHDPLPLLAQLEQRDPGAFEVSYLDRGPELWRLLFARR